MSCTLTVRTASGRMPEALIPMIASVIHPTVGDMLMAGQIIRSKIRERTALGVDLNGGAFAPYSMKGPYYYNPGTRGGKFPSSGIEHEKRAARSMARKLGAGTLSRSGRTIRFDSYAAFKAAFGRGTVDLMGIHAPHMLDAIVVRVGASEMGAMINLAPNEQTTPADVVAIGIYDSDAVQRARGHNFGVAGRLPQRRFLGISESDGRLALALIGERINARVRALGLGARVDVAAA